MDNPVNYSVVIPVYNSELSLEELCQELESTFRDLNLSFELIFVDDNSTDGSWQVLRTLKNNHPECIRVIRLARNSGQHNATLCGFSFAHGERIITMDDDLQHPPSEIIKLHVTAEQTAADVIYGVYRTKRHSFIRNIGSRSLRQSARLIHRSSGKGSSFRLINREIVRKVLNHGQHFLFLDEVFQWYTDDMAFVEVEHHHRKYNKSGYTSRKLFRLLVSILFSTCIILFSLGIAGEYLRRICQVQNKKPPYSIKEIL